MRTLTKRRLGVRASDTFSSGTNFVMIWWILWKSLKFSYCMYQTNLKLNSQLYSLERCQLSESKCLNWLSTFKSCGKLQRIWQKLAMNYQKTFISKVVKREQRWKEKSFNTTLTVPRVLIKKVMNFQNCAKELSLNTVCNRSHKNIF